MPTDRSGNYGGVTSVSGVAIDDPRHWRFHRRPSGPADELELAAASFTANPQLERLRVVAERRPAIAERSWTVQRKLEVESYAKLRAAAVEYGRDVPTTEGLADEVDRAIAEFDAVTQRRPDDRAINARRRAELAQVVDGGGSLADVKRVFREWREDLVAEQRYASRYADAHNAVGVDWSTGLGYRAPKFLDEFSEVMTRG